MTLPFQRRRISDHCEVGLPWSGDRLKLSVTDTHSSPSGIFLSQRPSLMTGNPGPEIKWSQFCGKDRKGRNLRVTRVRNVRSADFGFGDKILRRQQFHSTHSLQISLLETFSVQSRQWQTNFCWIGKHNTFYKKNIILPLYFLFQILWGLSVIFHIIGFRHNNANFGTNSDFHQDCLKYYFS